MPLPLEAKMHAALERGANYILFSCLLTASYAYYIKDANLMEDTTFDKVCKHLLKHWKVFDHPHKHLVTQADLRAGSLFAIMESQYPTIVKVAAADLIAGAQ